MLSLAIWLIYLVGLYGLWPGLYRVAFGRWPFAGPTAGLKTWGSYEIMDAALAGAMVGHALWLAYTFLNGGGQALESPVSGVAWVGVALTGIAVLLRVWALLALGVHFRIGHDPDDRDARRVTRGPYRHLAHPINAGLILAGVGQLFLVGLQVSSLALLATTVAYYVNQGRVEDRRWRVPLAPPGTEPPGLGSPGCSAQLIQKTSGIASLRVDRKDSQESALGVG